MTSLLETRGHMKTMTDLEQDRAVLLGQLASINTAIDDKKRQTLVACEGNVYGKGCGQALRIGDLTFIQTHWYETPWGCTGGDSWHTGEGQFDCPKCGHRNRLYDRPDIQKLKAHFKETRDTFDR